MMGQKPKLDFVSLAIAEPVVRRATVPVVVGVSAPRLRGHALLARDVMDAGAAGVMIAPPPALPLSDDQIIGYFAKAAADVGPDIPLGPAGLPTRPDCPDDAQSHPPNRDRQPLLRHAEKAKTGPVSKRCSACARLPSATAPLRPLSILCGNGALFLDFGNGARSRQLR